MNVKHSILVFFFCSFLPACNPVYNYPTKKITLVKADSTEQDYGLLSVRGDSAVVVLDWAESKADPMPFAHAELIKKNSIIKIIRDGRGPATKNILSGAGAGAIVGGLFSPLLFRPTVMSGYYYSATELIEYYALTIAIGSFAGALIGSVFGAAMPSPKELYLNSESDRIFLHSISAFPDKEPDEMQYIK
jgi:hypothetical protein